ncbi:MAG: hypothetical protein WCO86_19060, partial [Planctomycetota bacterium]
MNDGHLMISYDINDVAKVGIYAFIASNPVGPKFGYRWNATSLPILSGEFFDIDRNTFIVANNPSGSGSTVTLYNASTATTIKEFDIFAGKVVAVSIDGNIASYVTDAGIVGFLKEGVGGWQLTSELQVGMSNRPAGPITITEDTSDQNYSHVVIVSVQTTNEIDSDGLYGPDLRIYRVDGNGTIMDVGGMQYPDYDFNLDGFSDTTGLPLSDIYRLYSRDDLTTGTYAIAITNLFATFDVVGGRDTQIQVFEDDSRFGNTSYDVLGVKAFISSSSTGSGRKQFTDDGGVILNYTATPYEFVDTFSYTPDLADSFGHLMAFRNSQGQASVFSERTHQTGWFADSRLVPSVHQTITDLVAAANANGTAVYATNAAGRLYVFSDNSSPVNHLTQTFINGVDGPLANASSITLSNDGTVVYVTADGSSAGEGAVSVFSVDTTSGQLTRLQNEESFYLNGAAGSTEEALFDQQFLLLAASGQDALASYLVLSSGDPRFISEPIQRANPNGLNGLGDNDPVFDVSNLQSLVANPHSRLREFGESYTTFYMVMPEANSLYELDRTDGTQNFV